MTNREIHVRFCELGKSHRKIVNELVAMLPEIDRLEIFKDYNCASVHEYACKYAGLSYAVVQKALWVEEKLVEAPKLKEALKEVGVHKVALFATIANKENDEVLADKVKHMSKPALQELSKELRGNSVKKVSVDLDAEMQFLFGKIKEKLGLDGDEETLKVVFQQFLESGKNIPGDEKIQAQKSPEVAEKTLVDYQIPPLPSRYIPAKIRKEAISKTNGKCVYPNCKKPYEQLHHQDYFAHTRNHKNLIPLCKIHHEFMHNGVVAESGPKKWQIKLGVPKNGFDLKYRVKKRL